MVSCFNPCCIGLAIAAPVRRVLLREPALFQSLLYWISHCGNVLRSIAKSGFCFNPCCIGLAIAAGCLPARLVQSVNFQSLLYWISHCGGHTGAVDYRQWQCFNPCCIGLAIAALLCGLEFEQHILFQSLLYWISHCGSFGAGLILVLSLVSILVVLD